MSEPELTSGSGPSMWFLVPCLSLSPSQRTLWVRALYDFDAVEHDELGFRSGDIVEVLDSSNPSWWKGRLRGELGLFPANYVTPVLLWGHSMPRRAVSELLFWHDRDREGVNLPLLPGHMVFFAFVLIYWELIFWNAGKKQNPLKRVGFFSHFVHP